MKKAFLIVGILLTFGVTLAQSELPAGVSIRILDPNEGVEFEVAEVLYLSPTSISEEIGWNDTTTSMAVSVSSQVNTQVAVVVDNPNLMVSGSSEVQIRGGNRVNVSFTAYAPHEGTIRFVNTEGEVVATVPYRVTKQSAYRQNISASVNFDGAVQASYGIRHPSNIGFNVNIGYNPKTDSFNGGVSGSYSW